MTTGPTMTAFVPALRLPLRHCSILRRGSPLPSRRPRAYSISGAPFGHRWRASLAAEVEKETTTCPHEEPPIPPEAPEESTRMFSNIEPAPDGSLRRVRASEGGCAALIAVCERIVLSSKGVLREQRY